jgi:hypothetical protein
MYGLGWVLLAVFGWEHIGGTITESINSGLLLYGKGALGMDTIFKPITLSLLSAVEPVCAVGTCFVDVIPS